MNTNEKTNAAVVIVIPTLGSVKDSMKAKIDAHKEARRQAKIAKLTEELDELKK